MTTQMVEIGIVLGAPVVTEHNRYTAVCPHCHKKVHGKLPTGNSRKTSYGPKAQAMVVYLWVVHSMPYNRIAEIMRDVFGIGSFSEGTVKNMLSRNKSKAQAVYFALLEYIAKEKCAGMDETGVYINKTLCWFWCLQCARFCFVFADPSRGIEALKEQRHTGASLQSRALHRQAQHILQP
jgi:transposase